MSSAALFGTTLSRFAAAYRYRKDLRVGD